MVCGTTTPPPPYVSNEFDETSDSIINEYVTEIPDLSDNWVDELLSAFLLRVLNHAMKPVKTKIHNLLSKVTEIEEDKEIINEKLAVISDKL